MQLIDFKILMNELGIPVVGRTAKFCGVEFEQGCERESATVIIKANDSQIDIMKNFVLSSCFHDYLKSYDRRFIVEIILELAKYYNVQDKLKSCNIDEILTNANKKFYDISIAYSKNTEQWFKDNNLLVEESRVEYDEEIHNLLIQFDSLINPFIGISYEVLPFSSFSDRYLLGFASDDVSYHYDGHSCFEIKEYEDYSWKTSYIDNSYYKSLYGESKISCEHEFMPSLIYGFSKAKKNYDSLEKSVGIEHCYYGNKEVLFISSKDFNGYLCYDLNTNSKIYRSSLRDLGELITSEEREKVVEILKEAINFIHSKFVGIICREIEPHVKELRS